MAKIKGQTGPSKKKKMRAGPATPLALVETVMVRAEKMMPPMKVVRRRMRGVIYRQRMAKM